VVGTTNDHQDQPILWAVIVAYDVGRHSHYFVLAKQKANYTTTVINNYSYISTSGLSNHYYGD
jgi:hypothetical protein